MENIVFKRKNFVVEKELNKSEYVTSFLVSYKNKQFLLKQFNNPVSFNNEIDSYKRITDYGIKVPILKKKDKKNNLLLFQYVGDNTVDKILAKEDINDEIFSKLFNMYRFARFSHIELNYMPENYCLFNDELYYLSYNFSKQDKNKNLENYGIRYWYSGKEGIAHLEELGYEIDHKRLIDEANLNKKIILLSIMKW